MVEPLEETRSEIVFATEPVLSSLQLAIPDATGRKSPSVELDEIEVRSPFRSKHLDQVLKRFLQIQKGILQLCKGLSFLHTSTKLVHSNVCSESVVINGAVSQSSNKHATAKYVFSFDLRVIGK